MMWLRMFRSQAAIRAGRRARRTSPAHSGQIVFDLGAAPADGTVRLTTPSRLKLAELLNQHLLRDGRIAFSVPKSAGCRARRDGRCSPFSSAPPGFDNACFDPRAAMSGVTSSSLPVGEYPTFCGSCHFGSIAAHDIPSRQPDEKTIGRHSRTRRTAARWCWWHPGESCSALAARLRKAGAVVLTTARTRPDELRRNSCLSRRMRHPEGAPWSRMPSCNGSAASISWFMRRRLVGSRGGLRCSRR